MFEKKKHVEPEKSQGWDTLNDREERGLWLKGTTGN